MNDEQMREALEDLIEAVRLIYIAKGASGAAADIVRDQIRERVRAASAALESGDGEAA
jgi:molybdopterin biosynthesis enzyme